MSCRQQINQNELKEDLFLERGDTFRLTSTGLNKPESLDFTISQNGEADMRIHPPLIPGNSKVAVPFMGQQLGHRDRVPIWGFDFTIEMELTKIIRP